MSSATADTTSSCESVSFEPETSGGLLIALEPERARQYVDQARADGLNGWIVGEVIEGEGIEVV